MKTNTLFLLMFCLGLQSFAPAENYRTYYREAYEDALSLIGHQQNAFHKIAKQHHIDEKSLKAVVFPELLRFNMLQNLIETKALELLYVNGGSQIANFSIGQFQMKPSFAENIEELAASNESWSEDFQSLCSYGHITDEAEIRKQRVQRLSNPDWQLKYLACFYKFAEKKLDKKITKTDKVRKISARYNCGVHKSEKEIDKITSRPSFPYGYSVDPEIQHIYSDISAFFYTQP